MKSRPVRKGSLRSSLLSVESINPFFLFIRATLLLFGLTLFAPAQSVLAQGPPSWVEDELLVGVRANVPRAHAEALYHSQGAAIQGEIPQIGVHVIQVPPSALETVERALSRHPEIEFVEKNFFATGVYVPDDPKYGSQWHLSKISAPSGWDLSTGSSQIVLAVIDSGIDPTHPDLAGKLLPGYNFLDSTTNTSDVLGHGTAVAGTAAAITDNQTGVAGVAWDNPILPLVVLNSSNSASYSNIASAITYAVDNGADVINISIGGSSYSSTLQNAVNYAWNKGAIVIASAMNNADSYPKYPAALDNVVAVSATDSSDSLASFSCYGNWIDLSAPGVYILTTTRGGGYGAWNGTSFSSPIVAGLAALVLSANPDLSNAQVVSLMKQYSDDLGSPGQDPYFGAGRVNVYETLQAALNTSPSPDTTSPSVTITWPPNGSAASDTIPVEISATDNVGVVAVDLYINGTYFATDTTAPYGFAWNTNGLTEGYYRLVAFAYDAVQNEGVSSEVTVIIDHTAPKAPTSLSAAIQRKKVQLSWNAATDNLGISGYVVYRDGIQIGETTSTSYADNSAGSGGTYSYSIAAYDLADNMSDLSNTVSITVGGGGGSKGGGGKGGGGKGKK